MAQPTHMGVRVVRWAEQRAWSSPTESDGVRRRQLNNCVPSLGSTLNRPPRTPLSIGAQGHIGWWRRFAARHPPAQATRRASQTHPRAEGAPECGAGYLSCCLSISAPRSLTLIPSPRSNRITVCQRTPRRPFSTWDTYVTSIPDRAASASWVNEARWRRARNARPTVRWSLAASSMSVVSSSTTRCNRPPDLVVSTRASPSDPNPT